MNELNNTWNEIMDKIILPCKALSLEIHLIIADLFCWWNKEKYVHFVANYVVGLFLHYVPTSCPTTGMTLTL